MAASRALLSARSKLKRAKKHILDFRVAINAFNKTKPYKVVVKKDAEGRWCNRLERLRKVPIGLSAIAGDALFNLRSALDHTAWALWLAGTSSGIPGIDEKFVAFPIADCPKGYRDGKFGRIKGLTKAAIKAMDAIEPYQGGNGHKLWILHKLNNADKHRLLLSIAIGQRPLDFGAVFNCVATRLGRPEAATYGAIYFAPKDTLYAVKRGDELLTGTTNSRKFNNDAKFTFEIAFNEPHVSHAESAVQTLQTLAEAVAHVVDQLDRLL